MTYLDLLTQLTSQVSGVSAEAARNTWREALTKQGVLDFALRQAPKLMVSEAEQSRHRRTSLETVALQCFVRSSQGLDWWGIRELVKRTLKSMGG